MPPKQRTVSLISASKVWDCIVFGPPASSSHFDLYPSTCGLPSGKSTKRISAAGRITSYNVCYTKLLRHLRPLLTRHNIPMIVDPKPVHADLFKGATIITPNHHEAEKMSGVTISDEDSLYLAAEILRKKLDSKAVLITRGEARNNFV